MGIICVHTVMGLWSIWFILPFSTRSVARVSLVLCSLLDPSISRAGESGYGTVFDYYLGLRSHTSASYGSIPAGDVCVRTPSFFLFFFFFLPPLWEHLSLGGAWSTHSVEQHEHMGHPFAYSFLLAAVHRIGRGLLSFLSWALLVNWIKPSTMPIAIRELFCSTCLFLGYFFCPQSIFMWLCDLSFPDAFFFSPQLCGTSWLQ